MKKLKTIAFVLLIGSYSFAQVKDTIPEETVDYSKFADADGAKRFCNQKVLNQSPSRIVSIGYEYHGAYQMPVLVSSFPAVVAGFNVKSLSGLRAQVNVPVISNNQIIVQLGANYWNSRLRFKENTQSFNIANKLNQNAMQTAGLSAIVFKPLNEKNFLLFQASADVNAIFDELKEINSKAITLSGVAVFGWKKSDKNLFGFGISRTYRAGQPMIFPVVLWNKTFTDRWGMELLLPARAHLRHNFSTTSMLQLGYELEGNQYLMKNSGSPYNGDLFIQRGELKPRLMLDQKIAGFIWLNVQAGLRYNWRFDVTTQYNARSESKQLFESSLGNPFYFNVSLNFVTL
jgi:Domain of unknown function (DUF6268)